MTDSLIGKLNELEDSVPFGYTKEQERAHGRAVTDCIEIIRKHFMEDAANRKTAEPIADGVYTSSTSTLIERLQRLRGHLLSLDSDSGDAKLLHEAICALVKKQEEILPSESVSKEKDEKITNASALQERMYKALKAILITDERGQGTLFQEAMNEAADICNLIEDGTSK